MGRTPRQRPKGSGKIVTGGENFGMGGGPWGVLRGSGFPGAYTMQLLLKNERT